MRIPLIALAAVFCSFALASPAFGQRVPFFAGAATGFDPEISVVNSGEILDAQVVVSNDLKYVTINARPSSSQLLALREFSFAGGGRGAAAGVRRRGGRGRTRRQWRGRQRARPCRHDPRRAFRGLIGRAGRAYTGSRRGRGVRASNFEHPTGHPMSETNPAHAAPETRSRTRLCIPILRSRRVPRAAPRPRRPRRSGAFRPG